MLAACFSLAAATLALAAAACMGYEVSAALAAVSVPLAGLGGYSYTQGKRAEVPYNLEHDRRRYDTDH